jgi:hypothetical protein
MNSLFRSLSRISVCSLILSVCLGSPSNAQSRQTTRYDTTALKRDLSLLRDALEKYHPSLYAYIPKTELDKSFSQTLDAIRDSLTASTFAYRIVAPYIARIRCGHTSVSVSDRLKKELRIHPPPGFPLFLKFFGDTMMVSRNLNRTDSFLKKGTIVLQINGMDSRALKERLFACFPMDGYAESVNIARLNNNFPYYLRMVMGADTTFTIEYLDEQNRPVTRTISAFRPVAASKNPQKARSPTPVQQRAIRSNRELAIDSASGVAYMFLANFDHPMRTRSFIRKSFRNIDRLGIGHLIIDLRSNGGGVIDNEVFLARHLRNTQFRVADTAMAINRRFHGYGKYFRNEWMNGLIMHLFTRKDEHGRFHMSGYWEKRTFKPVKHRFFDGQIYILTGGMTFSAASLFCKTMKGQENVRLIGEETGGSGYANNGLLIPDFILPNSRIRVRMPLFRVVPDRNSVNDGRGVIPDMIIAPSSASLKEGYDPVMLTALWQIRQFDKTRKPSTDLK